MQRKKMLIALLGLSLLVGVAFAATYTMWHYEKSFTVKLPAEPAVQYTVTQDLPNELELDKEYLMVVECRNVKTIPYNVWAYIKIVGPSGFDNDDIVIHWVTQGAYTADFTIGRGGVCTFTNHDGYWVDWTGTPTKMNPGDYCVHYVSVTILGSAPAGGYSAEVIVTGEGV